MSLGMINAPLNGHAINAFVPLNGDVLVPEVATVFEVFGWVDSKFPKPSMSEVCILEAIRTCAEFDSVFTGALYPDTVKILDTADRCYKFVSFWEETLEAGTKVLTTGERCSDLTSILDGLAEELAVKVLSAGNRKTGFCSKRDAYEELTTKELSTVNMCNVFISIKNSSPPAEDTKQLVSSNGCSEFTSKRDKCGVC
jgi:hypothetical protein